MKNLFSISQFPCREEFLPVVVEAITMVPPYVNNLAVGMAYFSGQRCPQVSIVFTEDSTRTKGSFLSAAARIGMAMGPSIGEGGSSLSKGESPTNTVRMLIQQGATAVIFRTKTEGLGLHLVNCLAKTGGANSWVPQDTSIIVGGAGTRDHPSQVILDVVTMVLQKLGVHSMADVNSKDIHKMFGGSSDGSQVVANILDGLQVAFVGDLLHSRIVYDWLNLGRLFDIQFTLVAPEILQIEPWCLSSLRVNPVIATELSASKEADFVYGIRLQLERLEKTMAPHEARELARKLQIGPNFLDQCRGKVMDALPIDEANPTIQVGCRHHPKVIMQMQSAMGIPTRMAILRQCHSSRFEDVRPLTVPELKLLPVHVLQSNSIDDHGQEFLAELQANGKEASIHPITSGTVIDRIEPGMEGLISQLNERAGLYQVSDGRIITGQRFDSRAMGTKSVIFLHGMWPEMSLAAVYGLVSPRVRLSIMRDGQYRRLWLPLPEVVAGLLVCPNEFCVTNHEPEAETYFRVSGERGQAHLRCEFCQRLFSAGEVVRATKVG